jgi:GNAT superfamily N-acetyltransferase
MVVRINTLTGPALNQALPDLARLRIEVFRAFPYLYDGTPDYEEIYLADFAAGKDCIIIAAEHAEQIIGCATGSALASHEEFAAPFLTAGYDPNQVFYFGESVLLPPYRGHGIGHKFFDLREAHATQRGYRYASFCAVNRPQDHPLKPENYSPLDAFWQKRGYRKVPRLAAQLRWREIGERQESEHPMQFWMRELV